MHMRFDSNEIHRRFLHTATLDDQRASPRTTAATAFEVVLQEICVWLYVFYDVTITRVCLHCLSYQRCF